MNNRSIKIRGGSPDAKPLAGKYAKVDVDSAAAKTLSQLGIGIDAATQWVELAVETAALRYRVDGGTPTATIGFPLPVTAAATETLMLNRAEATAVKLIAQSATGALHVQQYRD